MQAGSGKKENAAANHHAASATRVELRVPSLFSPELHRPGATDQKAFTPFRAKTTSPRTGTCCGSSQRTK
jgi:hypothetical protein